MEDKYIKIVYQTPPIGPSKIILYLTTFDVEKYDSDQKMIKQRQAVAFEFEQSQLQNSNVNVIEHFEKMLNDYVKKYYEPYIEELKNLTRIQKIEKFTPENYSGNIMNTDNVNCNIIKGNVMNCETVYCNEIKGSVINCDKIVYK